MAELRDSSLLFSLQSLLQVEEERIARDRAEQEQRLLEARRQRELEEQRAREAEQARVLDEQRRAAEQERLAREEAARLEAIRLAEVERVRLESAHRAELELAARRQQHERELAALAVNGKRGRARFWVLMAAGTSLVVGVPAAIYYGHVVPQQRAEQLEQQRRLAGMSASIEEASGKLSERERRLKELERERERLAAQVREAAQRGEKPERVTPSKPGSSRGNGSTGTKSTTGKGDPFDPLNGSLQ